MAISNIKIGSDIKGKYKHQFVFDGSTTSNFGFMQPVFSKMLMADQTNKLRMSSFVRLAPMPVPTFGRVQLRTYHAFVPYASLLRNYENMREGKPFSTMLLSYVPEKLPSFTGKELLQILFKYSFCEVYSFTGADRIGYTFTRVSPTVELQNSFNEFLALDSFPISFLTRVNYNITPDNADFSVVTNINNVEYMLCFQLSDRGKNLMKVFHGLGYSPDWFDNQSYSAMPLFCYYKVWFDYFDVRRETIWQDTTAYKLLDSIVEFNLESFFTDIFEEFDNLLVTFFDEISVCYYTDNPDFISAHIPTTAVSQSATTVPFVAATGVPGEVSAAQSQQPLVNGMSYIDQARLNILRALTSIINKNTVIGGKLDKLLRVHEGAAYFNALESNKIGSSAVNCRIDDVMANAQTAEAFLGEYAGKGIGMTDKPEVFTFETRFDGHWITLQTVVPLSGYLQQAAPELLYLSRYELPYKKFDAMGYEVTPKSAVFTDLTVNPLSYQYEDRGGSFGLIPRYTAYKQIQSRLGGDFRLGSVKDSLLPYTIDKILSGNRVAYTEDLGDGKIKYYFADTDQSDFVASEKWRYIGRYPWMTNFNRIFYNSGEQHLDGEDMISAEHDNFIIHNSFEFEMYSPYLPVSDSFETESDNPGIDVQHS